MILIFFILTFLAITSAKCPYLANKEAAKATALPQGHPLIDPAVSKEYHRALMEVDFAEVQQDIIEVMHDSQDWWPADYDNYGPFFIRLAWHCAGSYRQSDGRGGCSGGRQRFEPEQSW